MKHYLIITSCLLFLYFSGFSQKQQHFEQYRQIEIKQTAKFYQVNSKNQIAKDVVFYTHEGFWIFPPMDSIEIKGDKYVIIEYPDYRRGSTDLGVSKKLEIDSINSEFDYDNIAEVLLKKRKNRYKGKNGARLAIKKSEYEKLKKEELFDKKWRVLRSYKVTTGLMTIPFKFRPKIGEEESFKMTTDVTLGSYFGITKRLSRRNDVFLTLPITGGLTYVNIDDDTVVSTMTSTTTNTETDGSITMEETTTTNQKSVDNGLRPGGSWSVGLVLEIKRFNIGIVCGQDFVGGGENVWKYHGKPWVSFGIGVDFLNPEKREKK